MGLLEQHSGNNDNEDIYMNEHGANPSVPGSEDTSSKPGYP